MAPPAGVGGAIDLLDQRGERFTLQRLAGKPALLFFGFTRCSTTCPVALVTSQQVLQMTGGAREVAVVFVTLDPLHDDPPSLRAWLSQIHADLIGLTGSPTQVERAAERYGVGVRQMTGKVEHSSMWYLLDGQSRVRRVYPHTTPAADLVADVRLLRALQG
jgi:protein SCO1